MTLLDSAIQILNALSYASTLFLMASGLTLIFGVTRIVNFAHGSFFMLGAMLSAHVVSVWLPAWGESAWGYAGAMLIGALASGCLGALVELVLLRRMHGVPELYQLVATFGLTLVMHDAMLFAFGPDEVFAPRFPGLKGSIEIGEQFFPVYSLGLVALGPLVWAALHGLLTRTRWGAQVRAATADRGMLDALGINPRPLMLGAVALGCALAGLAGALQLPREPAKLQMDVTIVVETFVVVVTGGLGSVSGAFFAALLIGAIHVLGVTFFPQATLVLVFVTMALVLIVRPEGLMGSPVGAAPREKAQIFKVVTESIESVAMHSVAFVLWSGMLLAAVFGGEYWRAVAADALILMIFGLSLQWMMALSGVVSFGHAAFFALGAYGAALTHVHIGGGLALAVVNGCLLALAVAAVFGALVVRSSGVYLAMLSLALAQVVWAGATQWIGVTGGDNGLIGLDWVNPQSRLAFDLVLAAIAALGLVAMFIGARSRLGQALQASRDAPLRAAASGLHVGWLRYGAFLVSAVGAGLAGALMAAHKGAVFPTAASVATSVDALLVVLLGGVHQLWGVALGSGVLSLLTAELGRGFVYWKGALGVLIMVMMVLAPSGLLSLTLRRPTGARP